MPMKSAKRGKSTSPAEVTNVSPNGLWLLVDDVEHFLPYEQFPWFREATIGAVTNVQRPQPHHLYWPALDVDLAVESLSNPERYPLVGKARPKNKTNGKRPAARRISQRQKRS
jgi:hypothetical protein